jgi:hypothetical protein
MTSLFLFPGILLVLLFGKIRPRFAEIARAAFWLFLPLLLYAYLPIRSRMDPPLDWGNPETLAATVWVVSGRQFRRLMFSLLPYMMIHQVMRYSSVAGEFGFAGALASALGVCGLFLARWYRVLIMLGYTLTLVATAFFFLSSYYIWDPEGYLLGSIWAMSIWAGWTLVLLVSVPAGWVRAGRVAGIALLLTAPIWALAGNWADVDLSWNYDAIHYGEDAFSAFEPNAVVIEVRYQRAFTLWYYREVEHANDRDDVAVIYVEHANYDWGLALLKRKYPDLVLPDATFRGAKKDAEASAFIIENNIADHPIYIGALVDSLQDEGYRFEAVGLLYRVFPPE